MDDTRLALPPLQALKAKLAGLLVDGPLTQEQLEMLSDDENVGDTPLALLEPLSSKFLILLCIFIDSINLFIESSRLMSTHSSSKACSSYCFPISRPLLAIYSWVRLVRKL